MSKTLKLNSVNGFKISLIQNEIDQFELFIIDSRGQLILQNVYKDEPLARGDYKYFYGDLQTWATEEMVDFARFLKIGFSRGFLNLNPVGTPTFSVEGQNLWYELGKGFLQAIDLLHNGDSISNESELSEIRDGIQQFNKEFFPEFDSAES